MSDTATEIQTYTETHSVVLSKSALRNLQEKVIRNNAENLVTSVCSKALQVRGWDIRTEPISIVRWEGERVSGPHPKGVFWKQLPSPERGAEYVYDLYFTVSYTRQDGRHPESNEFNAIVRTMASRASQAGFGRWNVVRVDEEPYKPVEETTDGRIVLGDDALGYAQIELPEQDEWEDGFSHLFGLDAQIFRVRSAIEAGMVSHWNNRFHCALVGPPGCGKSDILQTLKRLLGEDAVLEFDATATTAAGAIKELSEREILPRVLLVEEIEKADEKTMSFLLSVLDLRATIRKTTARNTIVRDTKLFALATVNDVPLFEKLQAGALASRFSNMIYFERPSRELLTMILKREVRKIDGNEAWVAPAIDYCEEMGINDPRSAAAICLCGRDELLSGKYQQVMKQTTRKEAK